MQIKDLSVAIVVHNSMLTPWGSEQWNCSRKPLFHQGPEDTNTVPKFEEPQFRNTAKTPSCVHRDNDSSHTRSGYARHCAKDRSLNERMGNGVRPASLRPCNAVSITSTSNILIERQYERCLVIWNSNTNVRLVRVIPYLGTVLQYFEGCRYELVLEKIRKDFRTCHKSHTNFSMCTNVQFLFF